MASDGEVPWVGWSSLLDGPEAGTDGSVASRETLVQLSLKGSVLRVVDKAGMVRATLPLRPEQVWQASSSGRVYTVRGAEQNGAQHTFVIRAVSGGAEAWLARLFEGLLAAPAAEGAGAGAGVPAGPSSNHFDEKTDKGSAELYFHYYGMLQHQQNMLQDYIRTGTYHSAIVENAADFAGKAVMDVGCGSGILSLFAAQAGARVVYAVEASGMARFAAQLAASNPDLASRIKVLHGKMEELEVPEKVDVLVSEPMGTLLVNERMIETYVYARTHHLKPGGKMFPRLGRIHVAAFSDELLHAEVAAKASFWQQPSFYGIDLTTLHSPATAGYFGQVVVDQIPPNVLVSNCTSKTFDFLTCTEEELHSITMPLSLQVAAPCTVHGIASWFDVLFDGSQVQRWLSTAPGLPITHWFQLRCLLEQPLVVRQAGATVGGELSLKAHSRQSYDVHLTLSAPPLGPGDKPQVSSGDHDLKDPYYRQLTQAWYPPGDGLALLAPGEPQQAQQHGQHPPTAGA